MIAFMAVATAMGSRKWSCVINCTACTGVDAAEGDAAIPWESMPPEPRFWPAAAAKTGTPILHFSTDYVFDGTAKRPYRPSDPVQPLSVYGQSKAACEAGVREANPHHLILPHFMDHESLGKNFVKTMLLLAVRGESLRVVDDQFGRPTSAGDLAAAMRLLALRLISGPQRCQALVAAAA